MSHAGSTGRRILHSGLVLTVLAGVILRVVALRGRLGALNSDEAVVGLMARHLAHGEFHVFYWGQAYGGTLGLPLYTAFFALLGASRLALKLPPVMLSGAAAVLIWRVGLRTVGKGAAIVAGLMFWVWPAAFVWWSTTARGFYWECLVLGLLVLLTALRLSEDPNRRSDAALLGLAAGLGWWQTPQVVYFLVAVTLWLLVTRSPALRQLPLVAAAFMVGAAPWIVWNLTNGSASLRAPAQPFHQGYVDHLGLWARAAVPMSLGLRVPFSGRWLAGPATIALYAMAVAVLAWACVRPARTGLLLVLGVGAFPLLYAVSPYTWYVGEGRYVLFLAPFTALLLSRIVARRWYVGIFALVGLVTLTAAGLHAMQGYVTPGAPDVQVPISTSSLQRTLAEHGIDRVFADYWVAYKLSFESRERVIAAPTRSSRYPPYERKVRASARPAFVFVEGAGPIAPFRAAAQSLGVKVDELRAGGFTVLMPARRLLPEDLPPDARP